MPTLPQIQTALPLPRDVKILDYIEPLGLLALDKPPGIKSHPNKPGTDKKSLVHAPYDPHKQAYQLDGLGDLYLLHRLDSPTSGVILLTFSPDTADTIKSLFKDRKITKTYHAWVKGRVPYKTKLWRDRLTKKSLNGQLRVSKSPSGDLAETLVHFLEYNPHLGASKLELTPKTGLTHQLRVQAALHNHPILGDDTYGDFQFNKALKRKNTPKNLQLLAKSISFNIILEKNQKSVSFLSTLNLA